MGSALLLPLLAGALAAGAPQDERAQLLGSAAWLEDPVEPRFTEVSPGDLVEELKVIASRRFESDGFNTPEIQLHLPLAANSTYAEVQMPEPRLIGIDGRLVECRVAPGGHDVATQIVGIRLLDRWGEGPAEFARARGEIRLRYPLEIETRRVASGQTSPLARVDGPYVEIVEGALAEAPSTSPLEPVRGYDSDGRRLETAPFSTMRMEQGRTLRRIAFRGAVAYAELDRVVRAADVTLRYDVPIAERLSMLQTGIAPEDARAVFPHPSTRLTVDVRASELEIPLPDPIPAPTPAPTPLPLPTPEPLPAGDVGGPVVEVRRGEALSAQGRALAGAVKALEAAVPGALSVVRIVAYPPSMLGLSVARESGVEEWTWRDGETHGPREVDTSGLECRGGMAPGALTLERLPALLDDATSRVASPGDAVVRLIVGQRPCGTALVDVHFASGTRVVYQGDGHFQELEQPATRPF